MSTETTQTSPTSRESRSIREQFTANRLTRGAWLCWASVFTIGAAIFHMMSALAQIPQSLLLTVVLLIFALIQIVIAFTIVVMPASRLVIIVAIIDAMVVLLWIIAHTIGLPIGLTTWRPELLSTVDYFTPIMEGLAVLFLLRLVLRRPRTKQPKAWRTILATVPAILLVALVTWPTGLGWLGVAPAVSEAWLPISSTVHIAAGQTAAVDYCNLGVNGSPLAINISEPAAQAQRPAPMVFYIHGGEGITGYRQLSLDQDASYFIHLRGELLNRGFVVGSLDYGLAPLYNTRMAIQDVKCAVRFLHAHASDLGIDPQRVGVYGSSEGGYLSAVLGTIGSQAGFDVGPYQNQSSHVNAVVDMWGFTDLTNFSGSPSWFNSIKAINGGGNGKLSPTALVSARGASPLYNVAPSDPPFLIIHGTDDWFIAPHHSIDFAQRLHAAGVPATLVMVKNDGHGLAAPTTGKVESPTPDALVQMIYSFFVKTLAS